MKTVKENDFKYPQSEWIPIYNYLENLYLSSFSFENLPISCNEYYMKKHLLDDGALLFYKDAVVDNICCLSFTRFGDLNIYGENISVTPISIKGNMNYKVKVNDLEGNNEGVLMYTNINRTCDKIKLIEYAKKISLVEKTIDLNIHIQKTPYLMKTSNKKLHTIKSILEKVENFEPAIVADNNLDFDETLSYIGMSAPFIADNLYDYKKKLYNEALSFIGIENNTSEKRERLTDDEVMVSNGLAIATRKARQIEIEKALKKVNEMFETNIVLQINNVSMTEVNLINSIDE